MAFPQETFLKARWSEAQSVGNAPASRVGAVVLAVQRAQP